MIKSNLSIQQGWSEIIRKEFIPFIMSWLQHMAHKKGQYVIVAYWKEEKKRLLQVSWNFVIIIKISFVIRTLQPTLLGAHYTIIVWFDSKKTNWFTARPRDMWPLGAGTFTVNDYRAIIGRFIRKSFVIFIYRNILIEFKGYCLRF